MKKYLKIFIVFLSLILFLPNNVKASTNQVNLYLFYGDGCPHCKKLEEFLDTIKDDYPNLNIHMYETWKSKDNSNKLKKVSKLLDENVRGVPFTVIGGDVISGYTENVTDEEIIKSIKYYSKDENKCNDTVGNYLGVTKEEKGYNDCYNTKDAKNFKINIPFIGGVSTKNLSLPVISILIGLIDGFNPCAMWILLFLITMLINMKDKKRMWLLGLTFLSASAITYLLFMVSWLNLAQFLNTIIYIRLLISLVAIIGGVVNLVSFFKTKNDGCHVVKKEKRSKIFTKIKKFTSEKSLFLALLGIITLAISVNFVELLCSAGLPVIFTQILSMNNLSVIEYAIYILLYILFFLIDDIIVFVIAMRTLTVTGISTKYGRISHLVGGIIMILIGLLLVLKPEWLMFNF